MTDITTTTTTIVTDVETMILDVDAESLIAGEIISGGKKVNVLKPTMLIKFRATVHIIWAFAFFYCLNQFRNYLFQLNIRTFKWVFDLIIR